MKKTLAIAAVSLLALASCKKDYTCECTTSATDNGQTISTTSTFTINDTKKNATEACEANNVNTGITSVSCAIQ